MGAVTTVSLAIQGRSDPIPTPLEASCSLAQQVVLMRTVWTWSARPTLSGRVSFGPPHGYPGVTSPIATYNESSTETLVPRDHPGCRLSSPRVPRHPRRETTLGDHPRA